MPCRPLTRALSLSAAAVAALVPCLLVLVAPVATPAARAAAPRWFEGDWTTATTVNCRGAGTPASGVVNDLAARVGFEADPTAATPKPGDSYWIGATISSIGYACADLADVSVELVLPTGTTVTGPTACSNTLMTLACPAPTTGPHGGVLFRSPDRDTWALPAGSTLQIWVQVTSSAPLDSATLTGYFDVSNGRTRTVQATAPVWVYDAPGGGTGNSGRARITLTNPAATRVATNGLTVSGTVQPANNGVTTYLQIYEAGTDDLVYNGALGFTNLTIPLYVNATVTTLQPNHAYEWRLAFSGDFGGPPSPRQAVTTLAAANGVVGTGTAASCTEDELRNEVANYTVATITFACGPDPTVIVLHDVLTVPNNVTLDGGGTITLAASSALRTTLWPTAVVDLGVDGSTRTVTLKGLTVTGGGASGVTIGGVRVERSARVTLTDVTITGNGSTIPSGGGVYVEPQGFVDVRTSMISYNRGASGGGIFTESDAYFTESEIVGNVAVNGGGGIAQAFGTGLIEVMYSTIAHNTAGSWGGALWNGTPSYDARFEDHIVDSTVTGNSAYYGGAIYTKDSLEIARSTIAGNTAGPGQFPIVTFTNALSPAPIMIVAGNLVIANGASACDPSHAPLTEYYNVIAATGGATDTSCGNAATDTHPAPAAVKLQPLGPWGGPTRTHAVAATPAAPAATSAASTTGGAPNGVRSTAAPATSCATPARSSSTRPPTAVASRRRW